IDVLANRGFHTVAAKVIIATELFIAVGLWFRATRYAAVWLAVVFHVAIQLSASVEVFSYLAIAALVIWAVPRIRDRRLMVERRTAGDGGGLGAVGALDWLARFQVTEGPPGSGWRVVDRDGRVREGAAAVVFAFSRLPLTAWFALPLLLLPGLR